METKLCQLLCLMSIILVGIFTGRADAMDVSVWATGSTEKVQDQRRSDLPHDGDWDADTQTMKLSAVRGEHAPFQIVITATDEEVSGVWLDATSLRSRVDEISAEVIRLYLVHQVNVYAATNDRGQRGRWPDALVPLSKPFDVRFFWISQTRQHQSVWVDVVVPREQPPGTYRGAVRVTSGERKLGVVNIELTVHDIQLPAERRFPVHVGLYEDQIARLHGVSSDSPQFHQIFKNYLRFFLDNRLDPRTSPGFTGRVENGKYTLEWTRPDLEQLFLRHGRVQYLISPVPGGVERPGNDEEFPDQYLQYVRQHVRQVIDHAKQSGWHERLGFQVPVDEPNTAAEYAAVRRWADAIRSVDPALPIAITEQPKPENEGWGSLIGHTNSWIINGNYLFRDAESIEVRRRAGDQVMWYMSCDQLFPQPNVYIDRAAADMRMVPWISWRYRMSGMLYWNAAFWQQVRDPWLDPVTWKTMPCNLPAAGEGSLIYPGNLARRYTGQDNIDGPIGSMRLALLREGLEELELLRLLSERRGQAQADAIVETICRNIRDFTRDPNAIDAARALVVQELVKLNQ